MGLVKLSVDVGGISQSFVGASGFSQTLWEQVELVKLSVGARGIGQIFCGSRWD